jgi:type IV pilus biogenesis protein CpaD/CtpE
MRALVPVACAIIVTALAGCSNMVGTADPPQPLPEDPNPFTFKAVDYPYAVRFLAAADAVSPAEMTRLQDFLQTSSARPGDTITISADNTPLGQTRSARVRDILERAGLQPAPGVDINLGANIVSLVLKENVAVPPNCGAWPIFAGDQPSNAPSSFLGCALKNNLYLMVVDKRDLAMGRTPGPADAAPSMRAVQKYRQGSTSDNGKSGGSSGGDNSAGDSAANAATAAAGMADAGSGMGGSSNDQ